MNEDATARPGAREDTLAGVLAACREVYKRQVETIEADLAANQITVAQAQDAMRAARAGYIRDCDLAEGGQR